MIVANRHVAVMKPNFAAIWMLGYHSGIGARLVVAGHEDSGSLQTLVRSTKGQGNEMQS
jgi:hypothetical protein